MTASSSALKNLPPHVARELRRHVSPRPLPKHSDDRSRRLPSEARRGGSGKTVAACVALAGAAASIPALAHWWMGGMNEKDAPLTTSQVRRGAFLNSGSKDVGKDPNWDFAAGQYKKDTGYFAIFQNEHERKHPGETFAAPPDKLKEYHEKLRAFAEGRDPRQGKGGGDNAR